MQILEWKGIGVQMNKHKETLKECESKSQDKEDEGSPLCTPQSVETKQESKHAHPLFNDTWLTIPYADEDMEKVRQVAIRKIKILQEQLQEKDKEIKLFQNSTTDVYKRLQNSIPKERIEEFRKEIHRLHTNFTGSIYDDLINKILLGEK